jgi:hypothetical protein
MKNDKFKNVINERTLRNFDKFTREQTFISEDDIAPKAQRDPRGNKERDMRKISKKDRWDD